jgi:lipoprotein-anchoring transpeptidase ErfK/SrfK
MILISIPEQEMHVYRNGIMIGRSSVSTGSKGHETPGGVFTILEKEQSHRSKTYNALRIILRSETRSLSRMCLQPNSSRLRKEKGALV